jgi:hypothetical protein
MVHDRRRGPAPDRDDLLDPDPPATRQPRKPTEAVLALQRTAGNQAVARFAATLHRMPKEGKDGFYDTDYKDVKLEQVVKYRVYRITSEKHKGTLLYWDSDPDDGPPGYFHVNNDKDMQADYSKPFKIADASATTVLLSSYEVGENGKGVSNVADEVTLITKGLITCVGWLLVSDDAAYLTHIVVGSPLTTKPDGIRKQVDALSEQFESESGSKPTSCRIHIGPNPAYKDREPEKGELAWMSELRPTGCPKFWTERGGSTVDWTVEPADNPQPKVWDGAPIKVVDADSEKST